MRQLLAGTISLLLLAGFLVGCGRQETSDKQTDKNAVAIPKVNVAPPAGTPSQSSDKIATIPPTQPLAIAVLDPAKRELYDAALASALTALADKKWNDALAGFQKARDIQDNEFVRDEIAKLKLRTEREEAAQKAVKDVEAVLQDGKADEAAKLARQALTLYGDTDAADRLVQLRVQADALQDVTTQEDPAARFKRYRKDGETALAENNLRAAVVAFATALQSQADPDVQKSLDDVSGKLERYDALRQKAADLRRDPAQLDAAIDALKEAALAWDTAQVRQELDDAMLALQNRRDSISVADFDVRNDVGMPNAGAAVADALLPLLAPKYNLVKRDQLKQTLSDLKLTAWPDDVAMQQQVGKLANVRYVVVGRMVRIAVVGVQAQLIDVRTGLVVQTGKIMAPTMQEAIDLVPDLAKQLLLSDAAKMKADQDAQQNVANMPNLVPDNAAVPPAPAKDAPPMAPIMMPNAAQPGVALLRQGMFQFGPPPDAPSFVPGLDSSLGNRMVIAAVELGDNLFRSGQFAPALRKYQFAAALAPTDPQIQARLQRTQSYVPAIPAPPFGYVKPRLAVLTFAAYGDPSVVPTALCFWTPANLAPYYASRYDVVDPSEITWFMAKTGLNMMDIVTDPNKLRWLGRAVDVRNFVLGNHVQSANLDVNAFLVDSELGGLKGSGRITVQNLYELKLRLPELAALTMMMPGDQTLYLGQQGQFNALIMQGLGLMNSGAYPAAVLAFQNAVALRPDSTQAWIYLMQAQNLAQIAALQMQRQNQYQAQQAALAQQQQLQFALASAQARSNALAYAAGLSAAQQQANLQLRRQAQANLVAQGQLALNGNRYGVSLVFLQGAQGLVPGAAVPAQDLARARLGAQKARDLRIAQFTAAQTTGAARNRDRQLAQAQTQIATDQQRVQTAQQSVRLAQQKNDDLAYQQAVDMGQKLMGQKNYAGALQSFHAAQQIKQTPLVNQLIGLATQRQVETPAKTGDTKTGTNAFNQFVTQGNAALQAKQYATAVTAFQQALKLMPGDGPTTQLLQQAQAGLAGPSNAQAHYQKAMTAGQKAFAAKQYVTAIAAFNDALKAMPGDAQAQQALNAAQRSQNQAQQQAIEAAEKQATYQKIMKSANAAMSSKKYADAAKTYQSALKVMPNDPSALRGWQDAQKALDAAKTAADSGKAFADAMKKGAGYEKEFKYADAVAAYQDAVKIRPKDAEAQAGLRKSQYGLNMVQGQQYLARSMFLDAQREFESALRLFPNDPTALKLWQKAKNKMK